VFLQRYDKVSIGKYSSKSQANQLHVISSMNRKRVFMETRLIGHEKSTTVSEIASWANDLIGKEVPGDPGYVVINILQFQLINIQSGYAALILVEVIQKISETQVALKESDIEVIEQITSSIDEPA
jgi:hypothetical protein